MLRLAHDQAAFKAKTGIPQGNEKELTKMLKKGKVQLTQNDILQH
jgi:hypothetical protein